MIDHLFILLLLLFITLKKRNNKQYFDDWKEEKELYTRKRFFLDFELFCLILMAYIGLSITYSIYVNICYNLSGGFFWYFCA